MRRVGIELVVCLVVITTVSAIAELPTLWGTATRGLQLAVSPIREVLAVGDGPDFQVALRNCGTNDVFLNLGFTLANGRRHFPDSILLVLSDSERHSRQLRHKGPGLIAGRVDDYAVGLQTGAVHVLTLSLSEFWCPATAEFNLTLPKGRYRLTARFEGRGATHKNGGMDWTAWNFWEGTLESAAAEFEVRDSK